MLKFTNMVPNWDGSPWDANQYSAVEIWCFVAPTTPYTIKTGERAGQTVTTTADYDSGSGITQTSTIAAVGRYFVPGNGYVSLTGGTGGNFSINATQSTLPTTRVTSAGGGTTSIQGVNATGTTSTANPVNIGGIYKVSGVALSDGQVSNLQLDSIGRLITSGPVYGNVASGSADLLAPVKIGTVAYTATSAMPTFTSGQRANSVSGSNGNIVFSLGLSNTGGVTGTDVAGMLRGVGTNTDGLTTANSTSHLAAGTFGYILNGTTWDRIKKPSATGRIVSSANTTNATSIKASTGDLFGIQAYNTTAAVVYLKIYNKASAPTVGTDTPVMTIPIPPNAPIVITWTNGYYFSTGIAIALTGAAADADTTAVTAGAIVGLNLNYQ